MDDLKEAGRIVLEGDRTAGAAYWSMDLAVVGITKILDSANDCSRMVCACESLCNATPLLQRAGTWGSAKQSFAENGSIFTGRVP
jgi:hypothetical protein